MTKRTMSANQARRTLGQAVDLLPLDIMLEMAGRLKRADGDRQILERAGIVRALGSHLQVAVMQADPDWTIVRRVHRAWVLASLWDELLRKQEKSAGLQ